MGSSLPSCNLEALFACQDMIEGKKSLSLSIGSLKITEELHEALAITIANHKSELPPLPALHPAVSSLTWRLWQEGPSSMGTKVKINHIQRSQILPGQLTEGRANQAVYLTWKKITAFSNRFRPGDAEGLRLMKETQGETCRSYSKRGSCGMITVVTQRPELFLHILLDFWFHFPQILLLILWYSLPHV